MFTGLIQAIGVVEQVSETPAGRELRVRCPWTDVHPGESIAMNGACLTVRSVEPGVVTVAAITTTLDRTTIGSWAEGSRLNLERAVALGERMGGHFVLGHVDGVAVVRALERRDSALLIDMDLPPDVRRLMVPHGSLTVDGVSLTANALPGPASVQVAVIEFTERHTTLGQLHPGDRVHVEADVIGKYVQALLAPYQQP